MAVESPLPHHPRMAEMIRHHAVHTDLGYRATAFMQNFTSITESEDLIRTTHAYCLGQKTPDVTFRFGLVEASPIDLSELHAGALLVPKTVRIVFDISGADHNISYGFRSDDEHPGSDDAKFQALTFIISNPRDVARSSWQLVLSPLAPPPVEELILAQVDDDTLHASEDDTTLPPDGQMTRANTTDFSFVTNAILESLMTTPGNGNGG